MSDAIDKAIAAAAAPQPMQMVKVQLRLGTGKPAEIAVPADFDALDALCVQRAVLDLYDQVQARRRPQLVVARGVLPT